MDAIEQEIQAKGLTAPRITPADIKAAIASEHYFTAADGLLGAMLPNTDENDVLPESGRSAWDVVEEDHPALRLLTFCVLVMRNGFTVTGQSACASPENFDAELGRKIARQDAIRQCWPLLGYELRSKLAAAPAVASAVEALRIQAEICENNAPLHAASGNDEQAILSEATAASCRIAIEQLTPQPPAPPKRTAPYTWADVGLYDLAKDHPAAVADRFEFRARMRDGAEFHGWIELRSPDDDRQALLVAACNRQAGLA